MTSSACHFVIRHVYCFYVCESRNQKAMTLRTYVKLKVKLGGIDYVTSNVSEELDANSI